METIFGTMCRWCIGMILVLLGLLMMFMAGMGVGWLPDILRDTQPVTLLMQYRVFTVVAGFSVCVVGVKVCSPR